MSRIVKIVIAVVVTLLCVASMGVLAMRDASRRPEYCNSCHVVQPYYETWVEGDLLAHEHAVAAVPCQSCHPQDMQDLLREKQADLQESASVVLVDREWSDEECLACHGDEATVAELTQGLDTNPHASPHIGEQECAQCHKMHGPSEYACAECHKDVEVGAGWTAEITRPLDLQIWAPDMDCASCHSMEPYANSLQDTNLLAYAHAQEGLACRDCHTDEQALQEAHDQAVPGKRIEPLQVDNQVCFDCHVTNQHTSYEQIIERTEDYTIRGEKVNPHAITMDAMTVEPSNPVNPHASGNGELECANCHKMHAASRGIDFCYLRCHHTRAFDSCSNSGCH